MSYIVHVTAVVEGDLEQIEALINEYRYNCLQNQPGMESFYVCRPLDQPNVFLYTQVFKDVDAHKAHIDGDDPKTFFAKMEAEDFQFQGRWMAGQEINSVPKGHLLKDSKINRMQYINFSAATRLQPDF